MRALLDAHRALERGGDDRAHAPRARCGGDERGVLEAAQRRRFQHHCANAERRLQVRLQPRRRGETKIPPPPGALTSSPSRELVHRLVERHGDARRAVERGEVRERVRDGLLHVLEVGVQDAQPERQRVVQRPPAVGVRAQTHPGPHRATHGG